MIFSKDSTSNNCEYINIKSEVNGGLLKDTVKVGYIDQNISNIDFTVGNFWPSEAQKIQVSQTEYLVSDLAASLSEGTVSPDYWSIDTTGSRRTTIDERDVLTLMLRRSEANPGIAEVKAGESVKAKIAWSPALSDRIAYS